MTKDKKKVGSYLVNIFLIILAILATLPILLSFRYVVYIIDDYSNLLTIVKEMQTGKNVFWAAVSEAALIYRTWQGSYFGNFLTYFVLGLLNGSIPGLQIVILIGTAMLYVAVYIMGKLVLQLLGIQENRTISVLLYLTISLSALNATPPGETLYWMTGMCVYTIPFILAVLGGYLYEAYINNRKIYAMICACVLGFLAAGGSLQVAAIANVIYLLILFISLKEKKHIVRNSVPFLVTFIGALINALGPGNFVRRNVITTIEVNVADAVGNSFLSIYGYGKNLMKHTYFVAFIFILVIYILYKVPKQQLKLNPIFTAGIGLIGVAITNFPVVLGYGGSGMPDRCIFIFDLVFVWYVIFWTIYFALWMKQKHSQYAVLCRRISLVLACGAFIYVIHADGVQGHIIDKIVCEQLNGTMQQYEDEQRYIVDSIKNSPDDNVIVKIQGVDSEILLPTGITESADGWVNVNAAEYYGKKSIIIQTEK